MSSRCGLAVKDLDRSVEFFTELGFTFDARFTDEQATCMIVNDDALVMLESRRSTSRSPSAQS